MNYVKETMFDNIESALNSLDFPVRLVPVEALIMNSPIVPEDSQMDVTLLCLEREKEMIKEAFSEEYDADKYAGVVPYVQPFTKKLFGGHRAIIGYPKYGSMCTELTGFGIVSDAYKIVHNRDFFKKLYEEISPYVNVKSVAVSSTNGRFYVRYLLNADVLGYGLNILAINSYDTSASSQIHISLSVDGVPLYFDELNHKHKHTKGNNFKEKIAVLRDVTQLINTIKDTLLQLSNLQINRDRFKKSCISQGIPEIYLEETFAVLDSVGKTGSNGFELYLAQSTVLHKNIKDELRKIKMVKTVLHILTSNADVMLI